MGKAAGGERPYIEPSERRDSYRHTHRPHLPDSGELSSSRSQQNVRLGHSRPPGRVQATSTSIQEGLRRTSRSPKSGRRRVSRFPAPTHGDEETFCRRALTSVGLSNVAGLSPTSFLDVGAALRRCCDQIFASGLPAWQPRSVPSKVATLTGLMIRCKRIRNGSRRRP